MKTCRLGKTFETAVDLAGHSKLALGSVASVLAKHSATTALKVKCEVS